MADYLYPPSGTPDSNQTIAGHSYLGQIFTDATAGQKVVSIGWYRRTTGVNAPTSLAIFDVATATRLINITSVPDTGAVGWQLTPASLNMTQGAQYMVCGEWQNGQNWPYNAGAVTPQGGLAFGGVRFNTAPQAPPTMPTTAGSGYAGLTVGVEDIPPPDPATPSDVQNALAAWLSTTDGTHGDSAPLQDHTTLATVEATTGEIHDQTLDWAFGLGGLAHGYFGTVKGLIDEIKGETDELPAFIAGVTNIMLDHYSADIDAILAQIDAVLAGLALPNPGTAGSAGSAIAALSCRAPFPGTGWTMSAEEEFTDDILFAEPADLYTLVVSSWVDAQPANSGPAGTWLPRLGWWCPMVGSFASQRQFVDFAEELLQDGGRRMQGCAISLRGGTVATVQAWLLA